jgi:hypothetical protein
MDAAASAAGVDISHELLEKGSRQAIRAEGDPRLRREPVVRLSKSGQDG